MALWRVVLIVLIAVAFYKLWALHNYEIHEELLKNDPADYTKLKLIRGKKMMTYLLEALGYRLSRFWQNAFVEYGNWVDSEIEGLQVTTNEINGVSTIRYEPTSASKETTGEKRAVMVYIHGGGWTYYSARASEHLLKFISSQLKLSIISIDYRLSPEHAFPAAYDDCLSVVNYVYENAESLGYDKTRIAVSGDSAGGNLAAAVALEMKDKLAAQLLIYPALQAIDFKLPSYLQDPDGVVLTAKGMVQYWLNYGGFDQDALKPMMNNSHLCKDFRKKRPELINMIDSGKMYRNLPKEWTDDVPVPEQFIKKYVPGVKPEDEGKQCCCKKIEKVVTNSRFAPLMASDDELKKVSQAYVVTSGHDVLRDDGLLYAYRLKNVGIKTSVAHWQPSFHGFFNLIDSFEVSRSAVEGYMKYLKTELELLS